MQQTLKQLYSEIRQPAILPGTGSNVIAGLVMTVDLCVSSGLFFLGNSITLSHLAGFVVAGVLLMLFRLSGIDRSEAGITDFTDLEKILAIAVYLLVQAAIRSGCIASLSHSGLSDPLALSLGILAAALIGSYSSSLLLSRCRYQLGQYSDESSRWISLGITLAVCVFALRLVFLGGMEVIPQEAYYWNYAQHLSPGYLDHPPLVAATIYAGETVFGHNLWGSRSGAFIYGIIFIIMFYRYARLQVDQACAVFASSFALLLPYYFLGSGFLITPDAGLSLAWVMAIYFFYRVLINDESRAWYGVGVAMGIGMLSKYSIALLAPAALLFIILDAQARRQLFRKEPYIAVVIAVLIFSPVIYWNATHDWASFAFQAIDRFNRVPQFSLDTMLTHVLSMVTPLPLLALIYLFPVNAVRRGESLQPSLVSPFKPRIRLFIGSFLLLPLSVFACNALENEPRYNWTGPLWITILPMLAWLTINAGQLRWHLVGLLLKKFTVPILFVLISLYAILLHSLSIGLPGTPFPFGTARLLGWHEVSRNILAIQQQLSVSADKVTVIGMDKYFISSKLAYYGTEEFLGENNKLRVTGTQLVGGDSLMFAYWDPVDKYKGDVVIMLSRDKFELRNGRVEPYFAKVSEMQALPVYKNDFGLPKRTIREYYYRVGFGYRPPES
ncbi:MAG: glycosyltransferase family 39 protein [Gammaproteobacteria bacterium]|nr:glycosyltransferase family 39 protein [Gammaproteobacteria bacterium]